MKTPTLAAFLKTALKVQSPPYSGIHVVDGALLASDGCRMVVYTPGDQFVKGEGVIEPVNVKALLAYAEETYITQIRVNGNAVEFDTTFDIDAPSGYTRKSDTIRLAAFEERTMRLETVLPNFKPPKARLVASEVPVKKLRDFAIPDKEKVVFDEQSASFRESVDEDAFRYSAKQVREALSLFRVKTQVNVWIGARNELVFEAFDFLYAMTPFVIRPD